MDPELDDETRVEREDRVLEIEAPSFKLVVRCRDASGNVGRAVARPPFRPEDDD